jgi:nucleotide-binding universal stress UspA family protein
MLDVLLAESTLRSDPAAWPGTVVCGVDGFPAGVEAVRQAAALADAHSRLELVTVTPARGHPLFLPLPAAARTALAAAERLATSLGAHPSTHVVSAASPAEGLARAAADADLLVVGSHDIETTRGTSLGRVAKPLLSTARCSILIARRPPDRPLFDVIDLAAGSSPLTTLIAAHLAAEHGSELRTVLPAHAAAAAAAIGCGLVVTGDGADGARIAREAPCSVLIIRERR